MLVPQQSDHQLIIQCMYMQTNFIDDESKNIARSLSPSVLLKHEYHEFYCFEKKAH